MKKVLILGAGLVAKPMVDYLTSFEDVAVTVASRTVSKAEKLVEGKKNGNALPLLMGAENNLEELVEKHDVSVSLLPYTYHVEVAKLCLKHGKTLVTTSYVSDAMKALNDEAKEKEVLLLNEIGLDPGIDHMSAMRIIDDVHQRGGKIVAFQSYCGGLPAPEDNNNPWGYKFSWSPRGVLMAGRNSAKFKKDGKIIDVDGKDLFLNRWPLPVGDLDLETYPNRNSLPYIDLYGIPEAETVYRGTLRYPSWSRTLYAVSSLGLLKEDKIENVAGKTHREIMNLILGNENGADPREVICQKMKINPNDEIIQKMEWLGLFDNIPFETNETTPIDFLATLMLRKMEYAPGEKDMIVLYHDFTAEVEGKREQITSTLIDFGQVGGDSAMSRTVSLPAAIAVKLILDGKIKMSGVHIPVAPELYNPVLDELERLGIVCKEEKKAL
ncbi:MAG: saccharopine dehydrogenase C-terminal domain-containing protein [Calditrichia bacterium]